MTERVPPIVIDLGKKSKKKINALKRGEGTLAEDVRQALAQVREDLGPQSAQKELVPIVVVFKKKTKRRGRLPIPMIF
jgi:hypothetical protein